MDAIRKEFERNPLDTFVVSLAADADASDVDAFISFRSSTRELHDRFGKYWCRCSGSLGHFKMVRIGSSAI